MLTDFRKKISPPTQQRSCNELTIKGPSYLKGVDTYLVKSKCQETTDNLKQMTRLAINFNLVYYS